MISPVYATLIRTVMKVLSGLMIADGYGDEGTWEAVIGGVVGVVGIAWGIWEAKTKKKLQAAAVAQIPATTTTPEVKP